MATKGYSGRGSTGVTPDNTTEGRIPVKSGGLFVNSPLLETVDEIQSEKSIAVPTASVKFSDSLIMSSNSDVIEIIDCVLEEKHEVITEVYDDSGSNTPYQNAKEGLETFDVQLLEDSKGTGFSVSFPTLNDVHWEKIIVKPKAAGMGYFSVTDDLTGCVLNTQTIIEFLVGDIDTEVTIILKNPITIRTGQFILVEYSGPDLAGHDFVVGPIPQWDNTFVPYSKTRSQRYTKKPIALEEDIITSSERTKLSEIIDTGSGEIITDSERTKLGSITGGRYLGVFADLASLQLAYPVGEIGDSATVTSPNGNLFYWNDSGSSWDDSGTGFIGDMNKATYDPSSKEADAFSMENMSETATEKILTDVERSNIASNTEDITLNAGSPTQESLDLAGQELTVNQSTQSSDGVMSSEDKHKLDNIVSNGAGDGWISGLAVTENSPKDQTVLYGPGTYLINGIDKAVALGGVYDLENAYGAIDHYSGMIDDQHAFVNIYVDDDEVIKSERGIVGDKGEIIFPPLIPIDSVCIAVVEIKVDKNDLPKDIDNKHIDDCRNAVSVNTDEFVSVSADDLTTGYLADKIAVSGNVTATIINPGGDEQIELNTSVGSLLSLDYTTDANIENLDVSSIAPQGILRVNIASNREFRSLSGGVDKQIVYVINIGTIDLKVKNQTGIGQMVRTEGAADKTFGDFGGFQLIYDATAGYWYMITAI